MERKARMGPCACSGSCESAHFASLSEAHNFFTVTAALFEQFEPLIGIKSIQYANWSEGRARRNHYDQALNYEAVKNYYHQMQHVSLNFMFFFITRYWTQKEHQPLRRMTTSDGFAATFKGRLATFALYSNPFGQSHALYSQNWSTHF